MFEYDIKFPNDSILSISLHDSSLLSGRTELGKTEIDLEDRFYAKCYANCGIPQRYETTGYNKWRDSLTPCEILNRLCKQFGLEKPVYDNSSLTIKKPNPNETFKYDYNTTDEKDVGFEADELIADKKTYSSKSSFKQQAALDALNDWKRITGVSSD
jgi:hypothetical protein